MPIAGYAVLNGDKIHMRGLVGEPDGSKVMRCEMNGSVDDPETLGIAMAEDLLGQGADRILSALYHE